MPSLDIQVVSVAGVGASEIVRGLKVRCQVGCRDAGMKVSYPILVGELNPLGLQPPLTSSPFFTNRELSESSGPEDVTLVFPMSRETLAAIERLRVDDVPMTLQLRGHGSTTRQSQPPRTESIGGSVDLKRSQREWRDLLKAMGYGESWIIELARPCLEGFDEVQSHLEKASEAIQGHDYEGAVHNCRVAWDATSNLLDAIEAKIAAEIDRGSKGETGEPLKSERIKNLRAAVKKLCQIGAHKEAYVVGYEDALLCFRQTLSLMAYLSKIVAGLSLA